MIAPLLRGLVRSVGAIAVLVVAAAVAPAGALAHGADPMIGTRLWAQDQSVAYTWRSSPVVPAWMQIAFDAGAADVTASRRARAATFTRVAGSSSLVGYGDNTLCPSYAIACFDRSNVPSSFVIWFRPHGWVFDWGQLRWCEAQSSYSNGCYELQNVALDELGHVEILWHHDNLADGSDFIDAVVQTYSHTRPGVGWNEHAFGRCDVARLQLEYELQTISSPVSTCLAAPTATTLAASSAALYMGDTVTFVGSLRFTTDAVNRSLAGDRLGGRAVVLQRKDPAGTTWTTITTLTANADGSYTARVSPTATYDWRAVYGASTAEGLLGSTSATVRVSVSGCTTSGCPLAGTSGR